jgi:hypothetical protein
VLGAAAACADAPTASRAPSPTARHDGAIAATTLHRPTLIANRVKYRDAGYQPATGRDGNASLYVQALAGRDGKTEVKVSTDYWGLVYGWGPGDITQLQVKAFDAGGKLLATRTHAADLPGGGAATLTFPGMARGTRLQVQGAVRGIDPRRTGVPVVTGAVRLRPNLAVRGVVAPARVRAGSQVIISATVAETNGDVGAWSSCNLFVDGQRQDWAQWIWVDAGDAVTCMFFTGLTAEGKHRVEVRLGDAQPRDDDPADNSAAAEVEVYTTDELMYSASASQFETDDHTFTSIRWTVADSLGNAWGTEDENDWRMRVASRGTSFYGWSVRGMSRLPAVQIEEESGGTPLHSATYEVEPLWSYDGFSCGYGWDDATGVFLSVCTDTDAPGGTSVSYSRGSTRVTYHSSSFSRYWDGRTGEEQVYHYNYDSESGSAAPLEPWGSDFTLRVRLVDGESQLWAAPTFPLQASEYQYGQPLSCWTWSDWWYNATSEYCYQYDSSFRGTSGTTANWP